MRSQISEGSSLAVGTPIKTPTGRKGTIVVAAGGQYMPHHALILFPSGNRQWVLAEILSSKDDTLAESF